MVAQGADGDPVSTYIAPGDKPPVRGDDEWLNRSEEQFIQRFLSRPESFPESFWRAVIQKVAVDGERIPHSQINGPRAGYWKAYTPVWTATTTNPTTGNAIITGRYAALGQVVHMVIEFTYGSTSASGSGTWEFSLPPIPAANAIARGAAQLTDTGTANYAAVAALSSTTKLVLMTTAIPAGFVGSTVPFTWATDDLIRLSLTYEATR